jgi:hypothetical protein
MKPPFCATSLPLGDGAHCEEIGRGHLEMCDFSNRKYVTILFRGYPAAGHACILQERQSFQKGFSMKIALSNRDFRIFYSLNYLRGIPPPPKGRPRGGSITWSILENMELLRRAPEGP